jgi:hypothetical protein
MRRRLVHGLLRVNMSTHQYEQTGNTVCLLFDAHLPDQHVARLENVYMFR